MSGAERCQFPDPDGPAGVCDETAGSLYHEHVHCPEPHPDPSPVCHPFQPPLVPDWVEAVG